MLHRFYQSDGPCVHMGFTSTIARGLFVVRHVTYIIDNPPPRPSVEMSVILAEPSKAQPTVERVIAVNSPEEQRRPLQL